MVHDGRSVVAIYLAFLEQVQNFVDGLDDLLDCSLDAELFLS
jgi:tRNA A58 N-methylase Trm61